MRWLLLLTLVCACGTEEAPRNGKLRVVATTGMVADLALVIGGEHVHVDTLMGPGVDPHLYQATPSDMKKLMAADVVLYNGKGLEGKMADVFVKLARSRTVVAVTEQIEPSELLKDGDHWDPHVWFDVSLWARCAKVVGAALAEADGSNGKEYTANATSYAERLLDLHRRLKESFGKIPKERRVLITSHDAFRYLGRAYDFEVHGVQGISTTSSAGVKDIEKIVDLVVSRGIKAIFVESSVSPRAIRAVQEAVKARGHDVKIGAELFSDAMGDHDPVNTYIGMVDHNGMAIVEALR